MIAALKYKWDNKNVLDYALQEGERKKAFEIAREMKKDGLPITQIAKFTKLYVEEIEKLQPGQPLFYQRIFSPKIGSRIHILQCTFKL